MKVVLLAGGLGTRLTEETEIRPKPMVEIGGRPILWHIMKHYAHYGFKEFLVALGYKGEYIKRYFLDYYTLNGSMTLDLATGAVATPSQRMRRLEAPFARYWRPNYDTGGRLKRLESYLGDETFMITYGDGVSNIDLQQLLEFHKSQGKWVTVSAVRPPARFGGLVIEGDLVANFTEKPQAGEGWINGGFLVMEPQVFKYLTNDSADVRSRVIGTD